MERGLLFQNLTLLEDHGMGKAQRCPYCAEKHASKIGGYASEIAAGREGDEKIMLELAAVAQQWFERIQPLKKKPTEDGFYAIGLEARDWRRKIQGAHSHGKENHTHHGNHSVPCVGANCEVHMKH